MQYLDTDPNFHCAIRNEIIGMYETEKENHISNGVCMLLEVLKNIELDKDRYSTEQIESYVMHALSLTPINEIMLVSRVLEEVIQKRKEIVDRYIRSGMETIDKRLLEDIYESENIMQNNLQRINKVI